MTSNFIKNLGLIVSVFTIVACTDVQSDRDNVQNIDFDDGVSWIQDDRTLPEGDSLFYLNDPAPLFRKEFNTDKSIKDASLTITAAGYYIATINGGRVGKNELDPAWTDYTKRIYYTEYDVTDLVVEGDNCIGVSLGNGFYNPLPLKKWGRRNLREDLSVGKPSFIAKLVINYNNGNSTEVITDNTWKFGYGPIIKNDVYLGVAYDARNEVDEWDSPAFNDDSWKQVKIGTPPGGKLQKAFFPPVQITENIKPTSITSPKSGLYVIDMGVNFTGTYKIKLSGTIGDTIRFRFGERIYEDGTLNPMTTVAGQIKRKGVGGPGAPEIAWQADSYIIGSDDEAWFKPEFTYHTYRYMDIDGLDEMPRASDIEGLAFHTNVEDKSSFSSSSDLLNSIQKATERTFLSNLISVQSDCPAREKFGYGGDLNATSESFIYNYDMQSIYKKTIYDWIDAMNDTGFVDTAPFTGIQYCGISWESAYLTTQYYLYLYYGDTELVHELYELNNKWMDKVARIHPNGIVEEGLSDHESLEPVPVELTGTGHYLQCASIMKTFASVMDDEASRTKYEALEVRLRKILKEKFWDQPVLGDINRQTLFSTLLYHGVVPEVEIAAATDSLQEAVRNGPSGHFNTGIFGTKYILETLSQNNLYEDVFDIVNSTQYPGWGFMIDQGATTIWETWKESDNTFSNCHPMFGVVTEWYYRWLGGIRPDPDHPGFKEFILAPSAPDGLEFVNCSYESPFGRIVSNWKRDAGGTVSYNMVVPASSVANVSLPINTSQEVEIRQGQNNEVANNIEGLETGMFKLSAGEYQIVISARE